MATISMEKIEYQIFNTIRITYAVKGMPGLWICLKKAKGNYILCSIFDSGKKITVPKQNVEGLDSLHVFADVIVNQKEIDEFVHGIGKVPPEPKKTYHLPGSLIQMIQAKIEFKPVSDNENFKLMNDLFPNYNPKLFKPYHMKKIWGWYGLLLTYKGLLEKYNEQNPTKK